MRLQTAGASSPLKILPYFDWLFLLAALVSYGAACLAGRLAGGLALAAATLLRRILKSFLVQRLNVFHVLPLSKKFHNALLIGNECIRFLWRRLRATESGVPFAIVCIYIIVNAFAQCVYYNINSIKVKSFFNLVAFFWR